MQLSKCTDPFCECNADSYEKEEELKNAEAEDKHDRRNEDIELFLNP